MAGLRIWLFCVLLAVEHVGSQPAERPDIGGEWEITYSFNERRGDRGDFVAPPPCRGPFPYYHTFTIDIDPLDSAASTFKYCYRGTDCTTMKFEATLQEGNPELVDLKCAFRPYQGFSDFGILPFDDAPLLTDVNTGLENPQCQSEENPSGFPCHLGPLKPHDVAPDHSLGTLGKEEDSYVFKEFHVSSKVPYLWGSFCKQYNWPEDARGRNKFENGKEYFSGSWRNENETWVFLKDITTCSCYPQCAKCQERVPGTVNMRRVMSGSEGRQCLRDFKADESSCDYVLKGASGGAIVYYGDPILPNGEYQKCYSYATITGVRKVKEASIS